MLKIKTEYNEFEYEYKGAKFKLKEVDTSKFMAKALRVTNDGKTNSATVDTDMVYTFFIDECLLGWDGIVDEHDKPVPFSDDAKKFLTFEIKQGLFTAVQKKCSMTIEEKKS